MKAASPSVAQHRIHARKTLERLIYRASQAHRIGDICRVIEIGFCGNLPITQRLPRLFRWFEIDQN